MSKYKTALMVLAVFFIAQPCLAQSGIPDLSHCVAYIAYDGPGTASLLVVPDGDGNPFTEAHDEEGNVVDATITLIMLDNMDVPIAHYPFEDCWLESIGGGLVACPGGTTADANSDVNGMMEWVNPMFAGGFSEELVQVYINGSALDTSPGFPLKFNSPDSNGDGIVNLNDVAFFVTRFFSSYHFSCDFNGDGVINLVDVAIFTSHLGAQCP